MEIIKCNDVFPKNNSNACKVIEYSFKNKNIDLCISTITGRYPENGYSVNTECKMLVYILEGNGKIFIENQEIFFSKGDSILIEKNEKYYWNSDFCKISITCTPAWNIAQYKILE